MNVAGVTDSWNPAEAGHTGVRPGPPRRVREQVRDGLVVIAFSAVASSAAALALLLLTALAG
ncbi:MAG: hypothetical protein M3P83_07465 [Actinomycetota bacterium]|nr:hypothetical protein [Actinomycetota bacterium]